MTHIESRHDTAATWASENPVLYEGEVGWETDTRKGKMGDGSSAWNDLSYLVGDVVVTAADLGLDQVDNTSDMDKPISTAVAAALAGKASTGSVSGLAPLASPVFTGNPTAPTPSPGDNGASLATTAFVTAAIAAAITAAKLAEHPVGSLEFNITGDNPSTYIGGTWIAWGSGRVPVGVDTGQTEFATVEQTGGEKTHTLITSEIPAHHHTGTTDSAGSHDHELHLSTSAGGSLSNMPRGTSSGTNTRTPINGDGAHTHTFTTGDTGGGGAHNNLQPYITCYIFKRTA